MTSPPITAALTLGLTGRYERQGTEAAEAMRLWAEAAGVRLILVDDQGSKEVALRAYGGWIDTADLLIGPYASGLVIEIPDPARRNQTQPLAAEQRWKLARRLLNDPTITTADRIAGLFILLYAQPLSAIARLTTDRVTTHDAGVHVQLGDTRLLLLDPIADLVAQHLESRRSYAIVGRNDPTPWLFPGAHPGQHISEGHLGHRLARLGIYSHPGRHAALLDLSTQLPAAVLSRLLGVSASTADRWTTRSGNAWTAYAAAVQRRGQDGEPDLR